MISLETAKKLKDAGLKWEPNYGDMMFDIYGNNAMLYWGQHWESIELLTNNNTWLPRLDQLLSEIDKRGYWWKLYKNTIKFPTGEYDMVLYKKDYKEYYHTPYATEIPEEAAAQALLWILQQH